MRQVLWVRVFTLLTIIKIQVHIFTRVNPANLCYSYAFETVTLIKRCLCRTCSRDGLNCEAFDEAKRIHAKNLLFIRPKRLC